MLAALIITFVMGAIVGAGAVASVIVSRDPPPFSTRITIPPPARPSNLDSLRARLEHSIPIVQQSGKEPTLGYEMLKALDYIDALERHVR